MANSAQRIIRLSQDESDEIIFEIGVALQYEWAAPGTKYNAPYGRMGKELWQAVQFDLYKLICDSKKKEPRFVVEELVSGDIRELASGILTILVSQLSIPIGIAIPIAALTVKVGLRKFCALKLKPPRRSYSEILSKMKAGMQNHNTTRARSQVQRSDTTRKAKKT